MLYAITPLTLAVPAPNVARQQFAEFKATFNKTYTQEEVCRVPVPPAPAPTYPLQT